MTPTRRAVASRPAARVAAALVAGLVWVPSPGDPAGLVGPDASPVASAAPAGCAGRVVAAMTVEQRAGQLLLAGQDADAERPDPDLVRAVTDHHVGSVYLHGRSARGAEATRSLTAAMTSLAGDESTGGVELHVAVDQEGGRVQVLSGSGLSDLPPARAQGDLPPERVRAVWRHLGRELTAVGVTMNLAPVADVVPAGAANDPIGQYGRHFGDTPDDVADDVAAATEGLLAAGVTPVLKHFPGLGRADGNTDTAAGVRDTVTTVDDPVLGPFRAGIDAGAPVVMVSTARYERIDPAALAAFSPVVTGMLRDRLGFDGVLVTDDLGKADSVAAVPVGDRAVAAVADGMDLLVVFGPGDAVTMAEALAARARADGAFAARLTDAAGRVVEQKAAVGLVPECPP